MKVTAYIPCFNGARYLPDTIGAILRQTRPPEELLIVDDGSTDSTCQVASKYPVQIVRHERNKGLAAARNTALAHAHYPFLAAFDVDAVADPRWLELLLENLEDPGVAGVGGRLLEEFRDTPADLWRSVELGQDLGETKIDIAWPSPKRLGGFGTVFRTEVLRKAGGYQERYRTNYEDVDLCVRLLQGGQRLVFEPRAVMRHMRKDSFSSVLRTSWRWDFFTHYLNGGYNHFFFKLLFNFRWARSLAWRHAREKRYALLPLDAAVPFVHCYHDVAYRFSAERLPYVVPDPNSSMYPLYFPRPLRNYFLSRTRSPLAS